MESDLSGLSGPRLGFGMESGWSHLSGSTFPEESMSIDFDRIAEAAVDEQFGFRRGGAVRHPVRAAVNRRSARRDYIRGGWGSPGWRAAQAGGYDPSYEDPVSEEYPEEEYDDEEVDPEEMTEEEYGACFSDADDEEFGRRHPIRAHHRRRTKRRARRQNRRQRMSPVSSGGYEEPIEPDISNDPYFLDDEEVEDFGEYQPSRWHQRRGGPVVAAEESYGKYQPSRWYQRRGGPVVAAEESYGEYQPSTWHQRRGGPVVAAEEAYGGDLPVPGQSTFRHSLDTGLGFGLGFLGVAVGLNILASALGGRR